MSRKTRVWIMAVVMMATLFAGGSGSSVSYAVGSNQQKLFIESMPNYAKLDKDLLLDAKAAGQTLKGKSFNSINGNSYMKPDDTVALLPLDVRGSKKGIAILVDFPVENTTGKISDVPGVDYAQIPASQFKDLLSGRRYNPFGLSIFKWIAAEAKKLGVTPPTDRTLNNYYEEVSYGQMDIAVDVVGWLTLPHSYDYYMGQDKGYYNDNGDAHMGELVKDAINLADQAGIDFSNYAQPAQAGDFADLYQNATSFEMADGTVVDRIVSNIFIIHRGTGAEYSGDPSIIWSHQWDILSAGYYGDYYRTGIAPDESTLQYDVVDGVVVNDYNICPEVGQDLTEYYTGPAGLAKRLPSPADPGVFVHEFGHVLGLPDQYDYGYDSEGTGMFTVMASGSYGRDVNIIDANGKYNPIDRYFSGFSPVHMDGWSKYYLGFANPVIVDAMNGMRQTLTLKPVAGSTDIYKIVVPGSAGKEYFLLENRQQIGYDKGLAYTVDGKNLHGLVVYHVDETVFARNFDRPNEAANWSGNNRGSSYTDPETGENHYAIAVVQADGRWDMERYVNDGDSGDTFPGTKKATKLLASVKANPNTLSYYIWGTDNRSVTNISIDKIAEKDGVITCDVVFE